MPWYYAGPEARPVGPISLEELNARRLSGVISPDTYVIERTGQPGDSSAWRRFRDVFPSGPNLPPLPPIPQLHPPISSPHPLFPSAGAVPGSSPAPVSFSNPHYHPTRPTNSCCAWGFGLGVAAFFLSFACGVGALPAIPGFIISIMGLVQVHRHREQAGQRRAVIGLLLSAVALIISLIVILALAIPVIKEYRQTTTEQTSE
jgi:hypothetical protein